jgi:ankyrin repeat protein
MSERKFPVHPNLEQLRHQAKDLLRDIHRKDPAAVEMLRKYHPEPIEPEEARLADAQLVLARSYGFPSWPQLVHACQTTAKPKRPTIIKPSELEEEGGRDTWDAISAAVDGDTPTLGQLIRRNPKLARAEYWYTPAIHFAVREGHAEAVQLLLDAGADPEWNGLHDGSLIEMARERGHIEVAELLEETRDRRGRIVAQPAEHPIHAAARKGKLRAVRALLDADASLVHLGNPSGATPLHLAIHANARDVVTLLLDRGADVHAFRGSARGLSGGFWTDLQAIDLAIWCNRRRRGDVRIPRLLIARGATHDLTVAAALGDLDRVREMLDADPGRIREARPSGRRPLSAAVEFGHTDIVRLLLERGADPNWDEPTAPKGRSLHSAAGDGNLTMVELLLAHGADPNSMVDSSGSATFTASKPKIRSLLIAHGGTLDPFLNWIGEGDEFVRRVAENPEGTPLGDALTTLCTLGKRDLLDRLLGTGIRLPTVLTSCQSYLLEHADMLRTLLAHGMSPDLMNWQHQTLLHLCCGNPGTTGAAIKRAAIERGAIKRAAILLDAGADISARDDEYRSTPLAWAARANAVAMVEFLLARGAPTHLPDDEPWATPLAWAERRGHAEVASILRRHGAER